ncbi:unnamed protein product, partial [Rotaria sp. Silwood2]
MFSREESEAADKSDDYQKRVKDHFNKQCQNFDSSKPRVPRTVVVLGEKKCGKSTFIYVLEDPSHVTEEHPSPSEKIKPRDINLAMKMIEWNDVPERCNDILGTVTPRLGDHGINHSEEIKGVHLFCLCMELTRGILLPSVKLLQ